MTLRGPTQAALETIALRRLLSRTQRLFGPHPSRVSPQRTYPFLEPGCPGSVHGGSAGARAGHELGIRRLRTTRLRSFGEPRGPTGNRTVKDRVLHVAGFTLGITNALRHRLIGYRTPRPFSDRNQQRAVDYAHEVVQRWTRAGLEPRGARVLELGPGPDLGTGAALLKAGAVSYTAVDAFPLARNVPTSFYEQFAGFDHRRLEYIMDRFPALPSVDGQFDAVVSNAAMEHFEDVRTLWVRLRQLVSPSGRMVHMVDASTHMRPFRTTDPLNIYRYSEASYRMMSFPGVPNRLLAEDYMTIGRETGWTVDVRPRRVLSSSYITSVRNDLAARFRQRADLAWVSFVVTALPQDRP